MEELRNRGVQGLRWMEQYTKTDMVYLARGGFWAIFGQIIVSLGTFLLAIAFAHFVSKEAYGEYKYVLSIASILGTFTLNGIGLAVTKSVADGFEGTLNYAFWKNIKWSILFFVMTFGLSVYYFINGNSGLGTSLVLVGCLSPFWSSTNLYNAYLIAKKDFKRSAVYYNIIGNIFPSICIFIAILLTNKPFYLVTVFFVSNTLIGFILYARTVKLYKPNNKVDTGTIGYSKHLSFMGILGGLAANIDQVLIFHYIGAVQLAIYNFASAIPSQVKGPIKSLASLIFPKFTERSEVEIRAGMKNKFILLFVANVVMVSAYIISAPYIFRIFFPNYMEAVLYSQILSVSLLGFISIPAETYFMAKEKIKEQYIANISTSILQIVVMFVFVSWLGLLGVVIARVIIRILGSIINIVLYEKSRIQTSNI